MSGVTFIDSMMLGVLLGATGRARPRLELRIVVTIRTCAGSSS